MERTVKKIAPLYGPVAQDIPTVGNRLRELAANHHPLLAETLGHLFETGGKRIRPALVLLSGQLGRYDLERLVTLAASLEVVHTATLVHDDTIDQSLTRRGLKTVNALWNGKVAVLVGDFLFAQSAHLASQLDSVHIMTMLSETVMEMSSGELRQHAAAQGRIVDEGDYFRRISGKTASLFAMCCAGAAVVSGQSDREIEALSAYGTNLGLAFQIADDVLDFTGNEDTLGKPAGSDLLQGNVTLPIIFLAERLDKHSPLLDSIKEGTDHDLVVQAVRDSGALDGALARAREYSEAARSALSVFGPGEAKEALLHLSDHVVNRRR
jgi:geranylgeranyl pyrophosphate synthase